MRFVFLFRLRALRTKFSEELDAPVLPLPTNLIKHNYKCTGLTATSVGVTDKVLSGT